jgi:hypothetical protein
MINKPVKIGFDRFLALEWADYALELFLSSQNNELNYELLKLYIQKVVQGKESARKTCNQLKRLWLNSEDNFQLLRETAKDCLLTNTDIDYAIFHFGVAINVFPIFKNTAQKIGELAVLQNRFLRNQVIERVSMDYLNPSSIPRIVTRVIQTLENGASCHLAKAFYKRPTFKYQIKIYLFG